VVDDEQASLRAVRRALAEDCAVLTAGSAGEGLALLARGGVGLCVSDQRMPGTTGCEFLAQAAERHPDVVRVMLTGYADVDTLRAAINDGQVYHCLSKPWVAYELRQVVRRGLERYRAERERVVLQQTLAASAARAQQEADRRGRLLTLAAHELGTPVHILLNAIELAGAAGPFPPAVQPWVDMAQRATHALARVVAQIATYVRCDPAPFRLRLQPVDVGPLLDAVVTRLRWHARARALAVTVAADAAGGPLWLDRRWFEHALWNLLTNAVRCTPDGGHVTIAAVDSGDGLRLSVIDDGIGIDPAQREELFEPFSAVVGNPLLHGSGLLEFGARGLGLGLAMVRRIIAAHGGTVVAESAPGKGSCFTIWLPRTHG
jgi:signal transduction histidine kinase